MFLPSFEALTNNALILCNLHRCKQNWWVDMSTLQLVNQYQAESVLRLDLNKMAVIAYCGLTRASGLIGEWDALR